MSGVLSIILGAIVIFISYRLLDKEIRNGLILFSEKYPGINDDNTRNILGQFDRMEGLVNELNSTYYEFISDLEGKYSIHEKEISMIEARLGNIEKDFKDKAILKKVEMKSGEAHDVGISVEAELQADVKSPDVARDLDLMKLNDKEKDKMRRIIIELRQKGFNLPQIAKHLNVGVGELQLFLNINRIK